MINEKYSIAELKTAEAVLNIQAGSKTATIFKRFFVEAKTTSQDRLNLSQEISQPLKSINNQISDLRKRIFKAIGKPSGSPSGSPSQTATAQQPQQQ